MEALSENWFFVMILLFCVGVHFFGHGHGHSAHGHDSESNQEHGDNRNSTPR